MKKKLWFKAKTYGWGWYPSTWQGWLILAFYLALVIFLLKTIEITTPSKLVSFLVPFIVLTAILIAICAIKGEKPRWRWGNKD